jgi:hypothetical protein
VGHIGRFGIAGMKLRLGGCCGDCSECGCLSHVGLFVGFALRVRVLLLVVVDGLTWLKSCHLFIVPARVTSAGLGGEFPPCFVFGCLEEEFGDSYLGLKRRG